MPLFGGSKGKTLTKSGSSANDASRSTESPTLRDLASPPSNQSSNNPLASQSRIGSTKTHGVTTSRNMGNGASGVQPVSSNAVGATGVRVITIDNETFDVEKIKSLLQDLKLDCKAKQTKVEALEKVVAENKKEFKVKDDKIAELHREIDKLRSVLDLTAPVDLSAQINTENKISHESRAKKQGVSGESGSSAMVDLKYHEKDFRSKQLIKDAILENDFLKNLESGQVKEIVECMYEKTVKPGAFIIKEGEAGQHLYVSAEGKLEVLKGENVLGTMEPGRTFGELALLYNCNRTASVKALSSVRIWVLDRRVFQTIMMKSNLKTQEENIKFLRSVSLLKNIPQDQLSKIADSLDRDYYVDGQYVVREGEMGHTFFIIRAGSVKVTQMIKGHESPQEIRVLKKGDYFGERALLTEHLRTASVIAMAPGVEVLGLDTRNFVNLIGDLNELKERDYGDAQRGAQNLIQKKPADSTDAQVSSKADVPEDVGTADASFDNVKLNDLEVIATLGMGGFGRVELVSITSDKTKAYALKCLKKMHIVNTRQQEHVKAEKQILLQTRCPFIIRLYRTFKDKKYVYMLMEACLGGELWTVLRDRVHFDDTITRFCVAGAIEAFDYLHSRGIIYRDLKPENVLLDVQGYIKICDFGFAKKIGLGRKTWTFCGTPEYVAPEIVLNKGHDFATDYWSLGIYMFELLTGSPPFSASDPMKVYNIILKGLDVIEFPKHVSRLAHDLIKKLCKENPSERLGYGKGGIQDIKSHRYFNGYDWNGMKNRTMKPPIVPTVKSAIDASNFDKYPRDMDVPQDEVSGWDIDF